MAWVVGIGIGLALFFAFPKQMGVLILLLVIGAAGLGGYVYYQDQKQAADYRHRTESITLKATYDPGGCSTEFPILVEIHNSYTDTLQELTFELDGYLEGHSSPIYQGSAYKSDRILAPGQTYSACWSRPSLYYGATETPPGGLIWRASYSYGTFGNSP